MIRNGVRHVLHFKPVRTLKLSPYTWAIKQGLYDAANNPSGTSFSVFSGFPIKVAGKTGTAEAPRFERRSLVVRVVGAVRPSRSSSSSR